jgi:hypothetical protein
MGFLAYAKINPFAAAAASGGSNGFALQQSPKSPKQNPFSTTSPVHNPFMSFVDQKEEYWRIMSTKPSLASTSAIFGFNSETVKNTILNAKSNSEVDNAPENTDGILKPSSTALPTGEDENSDSNHSSNEDDGDEHQALDKGSSDFVFQGNVVNGEEGEQCVLQLRAKLFRLGTKDEISSKEHNLAPVSTAETRNEDTNKERAQIEKSNDITLSESKATELCTDSKKVNDLDQKANHVESTPKTEWIEVGTGPLRVLKPSQSASQDVKLVPRIVMRRESQPGGQGTKLILNESLHGHVTISRLGDKALRLSVISIDKDKKPHPISFLLKAKQSQVNFDD